jgi:hypothetical protein
LAPYKKTAIGMKTGIWILMGLILLGCKRDKELTPEEIMPLVGKWEMTAYETTVNGVKQWVAVTDIGIYNTVIFRKDGVLLYGNGKGMCCAPSTLIIGGRPFKIKPKTPVDFDELCNRNCVSCESVELEINQDEMIWTSCTAGYRARYKRVQ